MIFYNNEYPVSVSDSHNKNNFFYSKIEGNYLIIYDEQNLIIYNNITKKEIFNQRIFPLNKNWTNNFDIDVYNNHIAINYKTQIDAYKCNNYFKLYKIENDSLVLKKELHSIDNRNFNNNNDFHEMNAKILKTQNGIAYIKFKGERWYMNDPRENWCSDYQAIKPLEGSIRYDKIFCLIKMISFTNYSESEMTLDLGKVVGELVDCQPGGSNRDRFVMYEKMLQNFYISNELTDQEGNLNKNYFITYLVSYKRAHGHYRKHRRRHRTCRHWEGYVPDAQYNSECSAVFSLTEGKSSPDYKNPLTKLATISNFNSLHGNSMFENFRSNKNYKKNFVSYDGLREVSLISLNNKGEINKIHYNFTDKRIEKFKFNLQNYVGKTESLVFGESVYNGINYIYFYDSNILNSINFINAQVFKNKSYQSFQRENNFAFALTNDSIFEYSNCKIHNFQGFDLILQIGQELKLFKLKDYEKDFKEIDSIGNPKGVTKDNNYLYCNFDFSHGKFPLLWIKNKSGVITSDFVFSSNIKTFEMKNMIEYYEGNKNIYLFNQFQNSIIIYDLKNEDNLFKNGNVYSFNIESKCLNILSKQKSFNEGFPLLPIEKTEEINLNYCSNELKIYSNIENHNKYFYFYLFNKEKKIIQDSGINYKNKFLNLPNEFTRESYLETEIFFDLVGLAPNTEYILIIIPFSLAYSKNNFLNKTYDELKSSNIPIHEYSFKTNIVPKIELELNEKINNYFDLKIKYFNKDKYSSLKFDYITKMKKWNKEKFELESFKNSDTFKDDFLNRPLENHSNYLNIFDDLKMQIKNIYYDENVILLINHYDIFKNKFIFNKTNQKENEENYYIDIPFTFENLNDEKLNYVKKGLGYTLYNKEKINLADFPETTTTSSFDSITFNVPNLDFNQQIINNFAEVVTIKYQLQEVLSYKVHLMMLPQGNKFEIPEKFNPSFEHYKTFNIPVNFKESHSSYTKDLLIAGQSYSYYIEPIFYEDRINLEMNQMIWDKLITKDKINKKHKQYLVNTKEFKYLKNTTFSTRNITDTSFEIKVPSYDDILSINQGIEQVLVSQLNLRLQIFNKETNERVQVMFLTKEEFNSYIKINYFDNSKKYYITFNSCLGNNDSNFTLIKEDEKLDLVLYPSEYSNNEFYFINHKREGNKITFNFDFNDPSKLTLKMYKLNVLNSLKEEISAFELIKHEDTITVNLTDSNYLNLYENVYVFSFIKENMGLVSKPNNMLVALPKLYDSLINIKEKFVDYLLIDLKNVRSERFNTYINSDRLYLKRNEETTIDFSYHYSSNECILEQGKNLNDIKIINLIPGQRYQLQIESFFDNKRLIETSFPDLIKYKIEFPKEKYVLNDLLIDMDNGYLKNISVNRYKEEENYNLEFSFNYYGIECYAKVGFTKDNINLDTEKPFVWVKLSATSIISQYYETIKNVGHEELNFFIEFYETNKSTKLNKIYCEKFPTIEQLKRLSISIEKMEQVYNKGNNTTNSMVFYGTASPKEIDFNINCISLESNFQPNITFISYIEKDNNGKDIKKFKFTLNNLEYGYTYSKFKPIEIFGSVNNKDLYLDSYIYKLNEFKLKYPLLNGVRSLELPNTIKSDISFKFETIKEASYYEVEYYYRPLLSDVYEKSIIHKELIRNDFNSDYQIIELDKSIKNVSGYYKAVIKTLNFDLEPSDIERKINSTTIIEILYLKDKIELPNIINLNLTSEIQPILNWDFEDKCFKTTEDKIPDSLLYTNNFNLINNKDSNNWYTFDIKNYNLLTLPFTLNEGLNEFWFKTYNKRTNRYSDLIKKEIIFNKDYNKLLPDQIYTNKFFGIDKDGKDNYIDENRLIKINNLFKINKLSYIIKDNTNTTVSKIEDCIINGKPYINEIYIKIDYENKLLKDGLYTIEFYSYDSKGNNPKKFKVSTLIIKNININTPKIQLNTQIIV